MWLDKSRQSMTWLQAKAFTILSGNVESVAWRARLSGMSSGRYSARERRRREVGISWFK